MFNRNKLTFKRGICKGNLQHLALFKKYGTKAITPPKNASNICLFKFVNSPFHHHPKIFFQRFFSKKCYLLDLKLSKNYIKLKLSLSTYFILIQMLVWKKLSYKSFFAQNFFSIKTNKSFSINYFFILNFD